MPTPNELLSRYTTQSQLSNLFESDKFGIVSVKSYGAKGDGVTDDTVAIQNTINFANTESKTVFIPNGTYKISNSLTLTTGCKLVGENIYTTILSSNIVGDSLIKINGSSIAFIGISNITLKGNGVTGALGSGHAINFIDPIIDSGTHNPQHALVDRVYIYDFLGFDNANNSTTKIESCGIIQHDGVQNLYSNVIISNCGHGIYMNLAQNSKINNVTITDCLKYGLFVYNCENVIAEKLDIIRCGDGVESSGYPEVGLSTGLVLSARNENFVLTDSKLKNLLVGTALINIFYSSGDIISKCWIRCDNVSDNTHKGIYAFRSQNIVITENTFSPSVSGFPTKKYETIELYNNQTNVPFSATISKNTFRNTNGHNIAYNVKIGGNSNVRNFSGVSITGNSFGDIDSKSIASTIDAHVLLSSCTFENSQIVHNVFHANSNVTITNGVQASTVTLSNNSIIKNEFITNGTGTVTNQYSGITETELNGNITWDPADLADGSGETSSDITVTGASLGDFVLVSAPYSLQGITCNGYVSASNTVKIRIQNETGGSINLASGIWKVKLIKP